MVEHKFSGLSFPLCLCRVILDDSYQKRLLIIEKSLLNVRLNGLFHMCPCSLVVALSGSWSR